MTKSLVKTEIYQVLQAAFSPEKLIVTDDSDEHIGHAGAATGKGHFTVEIMAPVFNGRPLLESHRLIYAALGSLMQTEIHALRILISKR